MSKPRWTQQEDLLLVQKYQEYDGDFDSIINFFERNKDAIKKHFKKLAKKSEEAGVPLDEYVQTNAIYDKIVHIQNILIKEKNNYRIYEKIIKYSFEPSDVIKAILLLSQKNSALCIKLVFNFKYILDNCPNNIVDIFYDISQEIHSDLFLQLCCFLQLFCYDDLKSHIPYISEIENFNSYPVVNLKTIDDVCANARSALEEKRNEAFINDILQENKNLHQKIMQLKNDLNEKSIQYEMLVDQINELKSNSLSHFHQNQENYQKDLQQIDYELHKNNYVILKDIVSKYPFLESMINRIITKSQDEDLLKFSSLIKLLNRSSYDYLCKIAPLYCKSSVSNYTKPQKQILTKMIQDKNDIIQIIESFYADDIIFENHRPKEPIMVTLCGDAASLKPTFTSSTKAVYTFELLPLNKSLKPCVIHMMEAQNGPSSEDVVISFKEISEFLTDMGFIVKYRATDGDISFNFLHDEFFDHYIEPKINDDFLSIVDSLIEVNQIPISDLLHLLKVARARIVNHLIMIDVNELRCVNTHLFAEAVNLGPVFTDRNSSGAMKDQYVLTLFSWSSLVDTIINGRFDAAYYLLPYVLLVEAVRSPLLSYKTRLEFLSSSFSIFKQHYIDLSKANKSDLFRQRFRSSCIGLLFADGIFLKRIMNTIVGIAIGIYLRVENLPLQRIGSHDLELFFGHMRMLSFFDHSFSNALRVAVRAILIRQYSHDLNYPIEIRKRDNIAGIVLTKEIYDLPDIDFDGQLFIHVIKELMLGHEVDTDLCDIVANMINTYSSLIASAENYTSVKIPNLMSGRLPAARYNSIKYALSILPLPHQNSVFEYYLKNSESKRRFEKISTLKWCMNIIKAINQEKNSKLLNIPFEYDLIKKIDRSKIY